MMTYDSTITTRVQQQYAAPVTAVPSSTHAHVATPNTLISSAANANANATAAVITEEGDAILYIADMHDFFVNQVHLPIKSDQIARSMVLTQHIVSASDLCWLLTHADVDNRVRGEMALNICGMNPVWIERTKEYCKNNPNL